MTGSFFQVCGPTIPKDCKSITMYNGICVWINQNDQRANFYPSSGEGNFTACCHNYGSLVRHLIPLHGLTWKGLLWGQPSLLFHRMSGWGRHCFPHGRLGQCRLRRFQQNEGICYRFDSFIAGEIHQGRVTLVYSEIDVSDFNTSISTFFSIWRKLQLCSTFIKQIVTSGWPKKITLNNIILTHPNTSYTTGKQWLLISSATAKDLIVCPNSMSPNNFDENCSFVAVCHFPVLHWISNSLFF